MKPYELFYIVPTLYTDAEITGIQAEVVKLLESLGGKVLRQENLGKIRLAYPIKAQHHGSYTLVHFDAEPSALTELDRKLGLTDSVLRHTLIARAPGSLEKKFELSSYVAPLTEEAKKERESAPRRAPARPSFHKAPASQAPVAAPIVREEAAMSMEELDQKLDKILEGDIAENI
ncbi:30S ribosomal protein S6 [Candidatus Uhrbacteria bacterium]|nr:30S ribosomal protein S6 [Candidatus Uhrbacteria bacterium]